MEQEVAEYTKLVHGMADSISNARAALKRFKDDRSALDTKDGISLLCLKQHTLLSYIRSLALLSSRRAIGQSLQARTPPLQPFSSKERDARGAEAGDLVDSLIENRVVLEKSDILEAKMRYQIERLVRIAEEPSKKADVGEDPLAFRPNPSALVQSNDANDQEKSGYLPEENDAATDGIYRPPRLAPMPYVENPKKEKRAPRAAIPSGLATLSADPSRPLMETTSGLGGIPSMGSGRANYLRRLKDYEEENFTRVIMKKKDHRKRLQDEEDLALGGDLGDNSGSRRSQRAGALEDEFAGVLKSISRSSGAGHGDGYDELRQRGKKRQVLERSRDVAAGDFDEVMGGEGGSGPRKRTRFEQETVAARRRMKKRK